MFKFLTCQYYNTSVWWNTRLSSFSTNEHLLTFTTGMSPLSSLTSENWSSNSRSWTLIFSQLLLYVQYFLHMDILPLAQLDVHWVDLLVCFNNSYHVTCCVTNVIARVDEFYCTFFHNGNCLSTTCEKWIKLPTLRLTEFLPSFFDADHRWTTLSRTYHNLPGWRQWGVNRHNSCLPTRYIFH